MAKTKSIEAMLREFLRQIPAEDLSRIKSELIAAIRRDRFRVVRGGKAEPVTLSK